MDPLYALRSRSFLNYVAGKARCPTPASTQRTVIRGLASTIPLVEDIITPLLAAIISAPDFSGIALTLNGSAIMIGAFLNAIIAFVLVAAANFFVVVKPMNALIARSRREPPADPTTKKCVECLSEIPIGAKRCAFCAVPVA